MYLRIAKLEYEVKSGAKYLKSSPKGKLPFINDNGEKVGDSSFIIEYLDNKYALTTDEFLTAEQKALAYLLTKSLEENLYWCVVYSRWVDDKTWPLSKEAFFNSVPFPFSTFVPSLIRKRVVKNLYGQGIKRHSHNEVLLIADKSLHALSVMLGDKNYFFGDKISSFDATAYSVLCQFSGVNYESDFTLLANKYSNLVQYCKRINSQYY